MRPGILSLLTFTAAWSYTNSLYQFPLLPEEGIQGKAHVSILSISRQQSFFGDRWIFRCRLEKFIPIDASNASSFKIPCLIAFPSSEAHPRPQAVQDYWVEGRLIQKKQGSYFLKVSSKSAWQPIEKTSSWAESRYDWKQRANQWIESHYAHALSGSFLAGLVTGEFDDAWMRLQFARFGLQHLLAISGFHFAIVAAFLGFALRLIPYPKIRISVLLICLGGYCFFLGAQASILRAWIMCSLTATAALLDKQTVALNSLGIALLALLVYNPLFINELGFQLSFAATTAILLFYQPASRWLSHILPKRSLTQVLALGSLNRHGVLILAFLRESLALALAVNFLALPLTLFAFHQFPWMSLLYNLFFPLMTSAAICLFLLGTLLFFFPPLATLVHSMNDTYTYFLLQMTYQIPGKIDHVFEMEPFGTAWIIVYLTFAILGGILWKCSLNQNEQEAFSYL